MRWRITLGVLAVLLGTAACSGDDPPEARTAAGVPQSWYATVDKALAEQPDVGKIGIEESGRCPLRRTVVLAGKELSDSPDHGVVRLGGDTPAVTCSWFKDTVVDLEVAHAPDAARYAELVSGTHAITQPGNVQTEKDVTVDGHPVRVVRIVYPTNPAAGTNLVAYLLDEGARGRVRTEVNGIQDIPGYDEQSVAADLVAYVTG
jgi:hypothetical protein